jgi:co-chaperonin GroES (HSP10)
MINESGLRPLGRAVLIQPYEPERTSSIIVLPDDAKGRMQMVEQRAVVIEVGPCAWEDESVPRANPGDKVIVARFSGYMAVGTKDGKQYRFINDRDIFAAIEVE